MAGFERARLLGAAALAAGLIAAAACAPPIPLERLPCPCLGAEGYLCCEREQICYWAEQMPATCALGGATADAGATDAADGDAIDQDGGRGGGGGGSGGSGGGGSGGGGSGGGGSGGGGSGGGGSGGGGSGGGGSGGGGSGGGGSGGGGSSGGGSGGGGSAGGGSAGGGSGGGGRSAGDRAAVDGFFPAPPAILATGPWLYTTVPPAGDWTQPAFDSTGWWTGMPGFLGGDPAIGDTPRTPWPEGASDLWVRTTFRIDAADIPRAVLWGRWDDRIEVYVNGALAAPVEPGYTPGYRYLGLNTATLVPGAINTLAVHATDFGGARYLDLAVALNEAFATMPMSGFERTPTLAAYAIAVRQFMREHGIPGGVLAVMKKDTVVVNRAFGWADKSFTRPLLPDAVMRAVGQEVIVTAGAVATLIDAGIADPITRQRITRDTRVFPLLRAHGLVPVPGRTPVPEIDQVTVGMLLGFTSGVSELAGDPDRLRADLGVAPGSPITAGDNVRWVYSMPLARPLGSPPGDGWTGYMVLRHLVHVVTGDLLTFLRTSVFAPVGSSDVFIAYEPLAARNPREPGYLTLETPFERSIYLENFTMLATTAEAFVRYLRRYHSYWGTPLIDLQTGQWAPVPDNGTHVLVGAVAGSWTVTEQRRHDEVSLALFFNMAGDYGPLFDQLERITDSLPASAWGL